MPEGPHPAQGAPGLTHYVPRSEEGQLCSPLLLCVPTTFAPVGIGRRLPRITGHALEGHFGLPVDLDQLLKLRLVVARYGEMDLARWWNTRGQLGRLGASALSRGFPRTHCFAQARSVFAVAAHRCAEVFDPPDGVTLWRLPEIVEEELDARWEHWLDHAEEWSGFFSRLETLPPGGLTDVLSAFGLTSEPDLEAYARLRRSAGQPAVLLPGVFRADDATITLLALGFARGETGALAVPHIRREG